MTARWWFAEFVVVWVALLVSGCGSPRVESDGGQNPSVDAEALARDPLLLSFVRSPGMLVPESAFTQASGWIHYPERLQPVEPL